jgi:uncharacterized membrane protein YcaP (DUF421 family)
MTATATHPALIAVVARVVLVYVVLLVMVRAAGKREVGSLAPLDFLAMLLLSETVSPALTEQDTSLPVALTAAATLLGLTTLVSWLSYRFRAFERFVDGTPRVVIAHGLVDESVCRSERISVQDLASALRNEGIASPAEVACATLEPSGRITVIPKSA